MNYEELDPEMLIREYLNHLEHSERLQTILSGIKKHLSERLATEGEEDERGHRSLVVGSYVLKSQKRQGSPTLDAAAVEEWAKDLGIWPDIRKTIETVDEDRLVAYVYDHRDEDGMEDTLRSFYREAPISYAFMKPVEEATYDY